MLYVKVVDPYNASSGGLYCYEYYIYYYYYYSYYTGVLYVRVVDPYKASYGVSDALFAITQLAQACIPYRYSILCEGCFTYM